MEWLILSYFGKFLKTNKKFKHFWTNLGNSMRYNKCFDNYAQKNCLRKSFSVNIL